MRIDRRLLPLLALFGCAPDPGPTEDTALAATSGLFSNVLDRRSVGWASVRGLSPDAFHADWLARRAAGYILLDQETDEIDGEETVAGVWQQNTDGRAWASWRNLSSSAFADKWQELRAAGFLLIDQDSYLLGGTRYYSGVWIENKEGLAWASYRGLTSADLTQRTSDLRAAGYLPIDLEAWVSNGQMSYGAIWVKNTEV